MPGLPPVIHERPLPPAAEDWVWPWWLQRQLDLESPAWQPAPVALRNLTGRSWTTVGLPEAGWRWIVDSRGLLGTEAGDWSVDWWVGAEDRWHVPSREPAVRQRLVDGAPVVETSLRVPGGDVVQRVWSEAGSPPGAAIMEIGNAGAAPVAVALSLRPAGPARLGQLHAVGIEGGVLFAEGSPAVRADVSPRQAVLATGQSGDAARVVLANRAEAQRDGAATCAAGWASAAVVWPLAHRASLRVTVLPANEARARRGPRGRDAGAARPASKAVTGPARVSAGWTARVGRALQLELPEGRLASAVAAVRRHLLLAVPDGSRRRPDEARVLVSLAGAGYRAEAAVVMEGWLDGQHRNGELGAGRTETAAALWALERWRRLGPDDGLITRSPLAIAAAAERLASPRRGTAARSTGSRAEGRGDAAGSGTGVAAVWVAAGLYAARDLLAAVGETTASAEAGRWADDAGIAAIARLPFRAAPASTPEPPAGAGSDPSGELGGDAGLVDLAAWLGLVAPRRGGGGDRPGAAPWPSPGLEPARAVLSALAAVRSGGDPSGSIDWLLSVASPTWSWPEAVHPRLRSGCSGSGHDAVATAGMWALARALVVDDGLERPALPGPSKLTLAGWLPADWRGQALEAHELPTSAGRLSWALRWHGARPALLWDVAGDGPDVVLTAPGLDPGWAGSGRRGEALLAPPG